MGSTGALRAASPMRSQIFSPTKSIPVLMVSFLGRSRYASIATRAARAAAARTSVVSTFVTFGSAIYLLSFCAVAGVTSRLLKNPSCCHFVSREISRGVYPAPGGARNDRLKTLFGNLLGTGRVEQ